MSTVEFEESSQGSCTRCVSCRSLTTLIFVDYYGTAKLSTAVS
jgi:hypothetical protein